MVEGRDDGGDAEADVLRGVKREDGESDEDASGGGAKWCEGDAAAEEVGDGVGDASESHADYAEDDTGGHCSEDAFDGDGGDRGDRVDGVVDVPGLGGEIAEEGGEEARDECVVVEGADGEDFDAEDGTGERRTEDGAEACADAGHEQDATLVCVETEWAGELVGE